jgi:hypothetical protein
MTTYLAQLGNWKEALASQLVHIIIFYILLRLLYFIVFVIVFYIILYDNNNAGVGPSESAPRQPMAPFWGVKFMSWGSILYSVYIYSII